MTLISFLFRGEKRLTLTTSVPSIHEMFVCLFACLHFCTVFYNLRLLENFSIIFISFGPIFTGFLKRKDQTDMIEVF